MPARVTGPPAADLSSVLIPNPYSLIPAFTQSTPSVSVTVCCTLFDVTVTGIEYVPAGVVCAAGGGGVAPPPPPDEEQPVKTITRYAKTTSGKKTFCRHPATGSTTTPKPPDRPTHPPAH